MVCIIQDTYIFKEWTLSLADLTQEMFQIVQPYNRLDFQLSAPAPQI